VVIKKVIVLAVLDDGRTRQVPLTIEQTNSTVEHIRIIQGGVLRVCSSPVGISLDGIDYASIVAE